MSARILNESDIIAFKAQMHASEKSDITIEKYVRDVRKLKRYTNGEEITKDLLIGYKKKLCDDGYAVKSVNSMTAAANVFFAYMGWNDLKMKRIREQRRIYRPEEKELTKSEFERLTRAASAQKNERLKLMIETICGTGIRVSELKYITVEAVQSGEARVSCKSKTRTVFIVEKLRRMLAGYCKKEKIKDGVIFRTKKGRAIDRVRVWREMKSLCKAAGVNPAKVFPHNLRHLFARTFYSIEKDIAKLADVLGHSSINTTRIYIISTGREHRRCMENMKLII